MRPQFPRRGVHNNAPTPQALYDIVVNRLHFIDVCWDPQKFDATALIWPNRSYCNPPFRNKGPFVQKAIESNRLGRQALLYLPLDPTTKWFKELYRANALILIFMKRMGHSKYPHALYFLKDFKEPQLVLIEDVQDVIRYLGP